jgi:ribosomal protein L29
LDNPSSRLNHRRELARILTILSEKDRKTREEKKS